MGSLKAGAGVTAMTRDKQYKLLIAVNCMSFLFCFLGIVNWFAHHLAYGLIFVPVVVFTLIVNTIAFRNNIHGLMAYNRVMERRGGTRS